MRDAVGDGLELLNRLPDTLRKAEQVLDQLTGQDSTGFNQSGQDRARASNREFRGSLNRERTGIPLNTLLMVIIIGLRSAILIID